MVFYNKNKKSVSFMVHVQYVYQFCQLLSPVN